jgi:hypothetical protein
MAWQSSPEEPVSTMGGARIGTQIFRFVVCLAIVLAIVRIEYAAHALWATANFGQGATFYFTLANELMEVA